MSIIDLVNFLWAVKFLLLFLDRFHELIFPLIKNSSLIFLGRNNRNIILPWQGVIILVLLGVFVARAIQECGRPPGDDSFFLLDRVRKFVQGILDIVRVKEIPHVLFLSIDLMT